MNTITLLLKKGLNCALVFFIILSQISCAQTQAGQSKKADLIDELLQTYADYGQFNGSILVAEKGKVIYKKGFGKANMEWNIPNETNTKFRLASVSKQFTAFLIVQLVSENKLSLHEPISTYLPNYPKEWGSKITLHQLLTHTSGIPDVATEQGKTYNPEQLVQLFSDSALLFAPGESYRYSNSGYVLLGYIIEQTTNKSYETVLKEKILTPLGMKHTGYDHSNTILENRASGYRKVLGKFENVRHLNMSIPYSAGGLYSTVEDLFIWDQALHKDQLLPYVYTNLVIGKHVLQANGQYYGYGWDIGRMTAGNKNEFLETISHDGAINGFCSFIIRQPSNQSTVILLSNIRRSPLHAITRGVHGILNNKSYDFPIQSVAYTLLDVVEKQGLEEGLHFYTKSRQAKGYYMSEDEMNNVGYNFLQAGKVKWAIEVFKLNIEAYPNSFNVYDSYGEGLMKLGETNEAIKYYKKSLELNPKNKNAERMIARLSKGC